MEPRRLGKSKHDRFREQYRHDPVGFMTDCVTEWWPQPGPTMYQREVAEMLVTNRRVAVRSPHGAGKTALAALLVLWFSLTREGGDWKVPTTASSWRQLTKYLWPEIHKWSTRLNWRLIGRPPFDETAELMNRNLRLEGGEAFAVASNRPAYIEGAHASEMLYVLDEAKTIPNGTWDAVEGAFSSGDCYALAISTPGLAEGRFYDIHARKRGLENWQVRHITLEESIAAEQVKREWAEQAADLWGEDTAVYQNRVLGEFCKDDPDALIPLTWVEAAIERWHKWHEEHEADLRAGGDDCRLELTSLGVDVGYGSDKTVIAFRFEDVIGLLHKYPTGDTMTTTGRVQMALKSYPGGVAIVDSIGYGAGVADRLRERGVEMLPFIGSGKTRYRDRSGLQTFRNVRSAAWWNMRELLDPANDEEIALPPDDGLIGDLVTPRWRPLSGGRIDVESKDDVIKRRGHSPDCGDAVVMAFWSDRRGKFFA